MLKRRYEMLLPLKYNDGRPVGYEKFHQTRVDLIAQFGSLTLEPTFVLGTWTHEGTQYEDELLRIIVDVEESPENHQFFLDFKTVLLERFEQIDIYLVSHSVDVL
jgi:hypothetical protein